MIIALVSVQEYCLVQVLDTMYDTKLLMPFAGVIGGFFAKFGGIVVLD